MMSSEKRTPMQAAFLTEMYKEWVRIAVFSIPILSPSHTVALVFLLFLWVMAEKYPYVLPRVVRPPTRQELAAFVRDALEIYDPENTGFVPTKIATVRVPKALCEPPRPF